MGKTIKEFAVKITSDAKQLETSFDRLHRRVSELGKNIGRVFGGFDKGAKNAARQIDQALSKALDNVMVKSKANLEQIKQGTKQELADAGKNAKQVQQVKVKAIRAVSAEEKAAAAETKRLNRQKVQDVKRSVKDAQKAFKSAVDQFGEIDIVQINKAKPIKDVQDLGRNLKSTNKTIQEQIRRELKGLDSQRVEDISASEKRLVQIVEDANRKQLNAITEAGRRRLRLADNNADKRVEIEREMQAELKRARDQGRERVAAVRQTGTARRAQAPNERRVGRISRGGGIVSELGQSARGASANLGVLGNMLGKLGPIGIAVAVSLGAVIKLFSAGIAESLKFGQAQAKIQTTINPGQYEKLGAATDKLRQFSKDTGVEINTLQNGLFNAASAVSAFKDDVEAGSSAVIIASKTAVGMSTDAGALTSVMGDLGNSFELNLTKTENQQEIMDVLATTFREGKITGDELSSTIVEGAKNIALLSKDGLKGVKSLGQMTASMTASGIKSASAATSIKALGEELLDMDTANKLAKAGLAGLSTEGGKVQVDFDKLFASVGADAEKFAQILGSNRAKTALRVLGSEGEASFTGIAKGYKDVSGASESAFKIMNQTGQSGLDSLKRTADDFLLLVGQSAEGVLGPVSDLAKGALDSIAELFKSDAEAFREADTAAKAAQKQFNNISSTVMQTEDTIKQMIQTEKDGSKVAEETIGAAMKEILATSKGFEETLPSIAANIKKMGEEGEVSVATLQRMNAELERAESITRNQALAKNLEAGASAMDALTEKVEELSGFDADEIFGRGDLADDIKDAKDAMEGLSNTSKEYLENEREVQLLESSRLQSLLAIKKGVSDRLESAIARSKITGRELDLDREILQIQNDLKESFGANIVANAQLTDFFRDQKVILTEQLHGREAAGKLIEEQATKEAASLGSRLAQKQHEIDIVGRLSDFEKELFSSELVAKSELAALEAEIAANAEGRLDKLIQMQGAEQGVASEMAIIEEQIQAILNTSDDINGSISEQNALAIDSLELKKSELEAIREKEVAEEQAREAADVRLQAERQATTELENQIAMQREELGIQEDITSLKFEQSDVDSEINSIVQERLGDEELSLDTQVAKLEELLAENDARLEILNTDKEILGIDIEELETLALKLQMEGQNTQAITAQIIQAKERLRVLQETTGVMQAGNRALGTRVKKAQKEQAISKAFGRDTSQVDGKGQAKAQKEALRSDKKISREREKSEKEKLKREQSIEREQAKLAKDSIKRQGKDEKSMSNLAKKREDERKKELEEAKKKREAREKFDQDTMNEQAKAGLQIQITRAKAEKAMLTSIKETAKRLFDLADGRTNQVLSGIKGLTDKFRTIADIIKDTEDVLLAGQKSYELQIKDEIKKAIEQARTRQETLNEISSKISSEAIGVASSKAVNNALIASNSSFPLLIEEFTKIRNNLERGGAFDRSSQMDVLINKLIGQLTTQGKGETADRINLNRTLKSFGQEQVTVSEFKDIMLKQFGSSLAEKLPEIFGRTEQGQTFLKDITGEEAITSGGRESLTTDDLAELNQLEIFANTFTIIGDEFKKTVDTFSGISDIESLTKAQTAATRLNEDLDSAGLSLGTVNKDFQALIESDKFRAILAKKFNKEGKDALDTRVKLLQTAAVILKNELDFQKENAGLLLNMVKQNEKVNTLLSQGQSIIAGINDINKPEKTGLEQIRDKYSDIRDKLNEITKNLRIQITQQGVLEEKLNGQKELTESQLESNIKQLDILKEQDKLKPTDELKTQINELTKANRQLEDELLKIDSGLQANNESYKKTTAAAKEHSDAISNSEGAEQIETEKEKIDRLNKSVDDLDPSNIFEFAKGLGGAVGALGELEGLSGEDFGEGLQKTMGKITSFADMTTKLVEDSIDQVDKIRTAAEEGDAGAVVSMAGDISKQIGMILLGSKIQPLQIAGAVMLLAGVFAGIVGKIISALKSKEESAEEVAQRRLDTLNEQKAAMEDQLDIMNKLADAGEKEFDTAAERLDFIEQQRDALAQQNPLIKRALELTNQQNLAEQALLKTKQRAIESFQGDLDAAIGAAEDQQDKIVDALTAFTGVDLRDKFNIGKVVKDSDIKQIQDFLKGLGIDTEEALGALEVGFDLNKQAFEVLKEQFDEQIQNIDFNIQAALKIDDFDTALDEVNNKITGLKGQFAESLKIAGVAIDVDFLKDASIEDLFGFVDDLSAQFEGGQIPAEIQGFFDDLTGGMEEVRQATTSIFDGQMGIIRAREAAGRITTEEADQLALDLIEKQLGLKKVEFGLDENATDIAALTIEQQMVILDLEAQKTDLMAEQNEEQDESNKKLSEAIRQRQKVLDILRQASEGGTLDPEQRATLEASNAKIETELRASGLSEDEIKSFMSTLPQFADGGVVEKTGLALVHKGEPIIPVNRVKEIEEQLGMVAQLVASANPLFTDNDPLARQVGNALLQREQQQISNNFGQNNLTGMAGNITININGVGETPKQIASEISKTMENTIINITQRAINQKTLDFRGVKT